MKKNIYSLVIILLFITACQQNEILKTHGIAYLEKREKLIVVNKTNKNDTINVLGQPSTKGMTDDNLWIYIERTTTRGSLFMLGRSYLKKNNVLVLEFDKYGILTKKEFWLTWKDLQFMSIKQRTFFWFRQNQWSNLGNKTVETKMEQICKIFEHQGPMRGLLVK